MTAKLTSRLEVANDEAVYYDNATPVYGSVFDVIVDDDVFTFGVFEEARRALVDITKALAAGNAVAPCGWLVDRYHPEPDSAADLLGPCGAPAIIEAAGWCCAAGHAHVSGAEYYEEAEVAAIRNAGGLLAPNALLMDGRAL
jgi:hypothetical protein